LGETDSLPPSQGCEHVTFTGGPDDGIMAKFVYRTAENPTSAGQFDLQLFIKKLTTLRREAVCGITHMWGAATYTVVHHRG